jgi:hypothetical protein
VSSGGGGAAVREEERGEVRETQGVMLILYRVEGEGKEARRRWRGSSRVGRPLMARLGAAAVLGGEEVRWQRVWAAAH